MKLTLLCSMLLFSLTGKSQMADSSQIKMTMASMQFAKFSNLTGAGTACVLLGGGAAWAGASKSSSSKGLLYGGAALGGLGILLNLIALNYVTKASQYLRGNSIVIPLHK